MLRFLLLIFLVLPDIANAGVFSINETDKSVEFLGLIFGSNIGSITLPAVENSVLGQMFEKLNAIIITFGTVVISYVGILSTLNTSQEGQVMGKKWSAIWLPLRSFLGMLLMVPVPSSGYSLIQITFMWVIMQGVGAANGVWNIIMENLNVGTSAIAQAELPSSYRHSLIANLEDLKGGHTLFEDILYANVCMETAKSLANGTAKDSFNHKDSLTLSPHLRGKFARVSPSFEKTTTDRSNPKKIRVENKLLYGNSHVNNMCGEISIAATIYDDELEADNPNKAATMETLALTAYTAKANAISRVQTRLNSLAKEIVQHNIGPRVFSEDKKYSRIKQKNNIDATYQNHLIAARKDYVKSMEKLLKPLANNHTWWQQAAQKGKKLGWIIAGSYYYVLNKNRQYDAFKTTTETPIASNMPFCTKEKCSLYEKMDPIQPLIPELRLIPDDIRNEGIAYTLMAHNLTEANIIYNQLKAQNDQQVGSQISEKLNVAMPIDLNKGISPIAELAGNLVSEANKLLSSSSDPLVNQAAFGNTLMQAAELTWVTLTFLFLGIGKMQLTLPGVDSSNMWNIISIAIALLAGPVFAIITMMWVIGASLAIYIPLVPYLIFTITAIGWLILVVESIVAAPIVALALVLPSQDELGKVAQGINMLVSIFIRPTLMLFGFILGATLYKAAVQLVNFSLADTLNLLTASAAEAGVEQGLDNNSSMLSWIASLSLYTGLMMTLVNKCFALIHILPDKVMRWLGSSPEQTDVGIVQEVERKMDSGTQKGQEMASSAAQAGVHKFTQKMNLMKPGATTKPTPQPTDTGI